MLRFIQCCMIIIGTGCLIISSCQKETPLVEEQEDSENILRELEVTVSHQYDTIQPKDSLLTNATVLVFTNKEDRKTNVPSQFKRSTDTTGTAVFNQLEEEKYYLEVNHDSTGAVYEEVKTPAGAVSYFPVKLK